MELLQEEIVSGICVEKERTEKVLRFTKCLCPSCGKVIPASIVRRDGYIYIVKKCIFEKANFESLIEKANQSWDNWDAKVSSLKHKIEYRTEIGQDEFSRASIVNFNKSKDFFFLITQRCNASCPICYDKKWLTRPDMSVDFIRQEIKKFRHKIVYLSGGEPTIREDLPEIIELIKKTGNIPGIVTNGLKLADRSYLRKLLKSGLVRVFFSFDGFSPEIYRILRNDAGQYELKLKALENLTQEKVCIYILSTIVKGVNEEEIPELVGYACRNSNIMGLAMRYLNLHGVNETRNFDENNLISREEMMQAVCRYLGIPFRYHELIYEMRNAYVEFISSLFPKIEINEPPDGQLYLKRGKIVSPVFTESELRELTEIFRNKRLTKLLKRKYLWWLSLFVRNRFRLALIEQEMHKNNVFSIGVPKPPMMLSDYCLTDKIHNIIYFPDSFPVFAQNWY